ncbi:MAG TPA: glutathione S-transferase C-terminal domain-containing protein [Polyangiaceae bacterium]|jgi:glutathione S-transferase|nr:glutathione S-transferase C-terminal domain-containing protein [Polyangiaceae bacterium]
MKLYFSPLACSLATRIALYEAGADATFVQVDGKTRTTAEGANYLDVNSLGLVPALELAPGDVLTENAAILQLVAARFPEARLAPEGERERARLQQWLSFISTELHKGLFMPLLDKSAPEGAGTYSLQKAAPRLAKLEAHLAGREFLLDAFSVADGYLFTVLNWAAVTPVALDAWPAVRAYHARLAQRPSIARAFAEERALYVKELAARSEPARASAAAAS